MTDISHLQASMMSFVPTTIKVPEAILWSLEDVGAFLGRVAATHPKGYFLLFLLLIVPLYVHLSIVFYYYYLY